MNILAKAQSYFPNMPQEVFETWLRPLIAIHGWPFASEYSMPTGLWARYLNGHSIQGIQCLTWGKTKIETSKHKFTEEYERTLNGIIAAHTRNVTNKYSRLKNGKAKQSFLCSLKFIEDTGRLHTLPVLEQTLFGYDILDGNHRIAALFCTRKPIASFEAWVGKK